MPNALAPEKNASPTASGISGTFVLGLLVVAGILLAVYYDSLAYMADIWLHDENYGHGLFVPFIALYIIWLKQDRLRQFFGEGSWLGLFVVFLGLGLYVAGQLSTLFIVQHLSLWIVLVGLVLATLGLKGTIFVAFPLGLLLLVIPLPSFLFQGLTTNLRLISSTLGVGCLQLVGITAFQDGNVIDLGPIQLQVVEACSGLRFLFPLMTLALLCAYFLKVHMWKRIVLFLSSIPISIFLNGFRIGIIGMLVEMWGRGAADGFLHLFEGWVVFVFGLGLLLAEMWLLLRLWPMKNGESFQPSSPPSFDTKPLSPRPTSPFPRGRIIWPLVSSVVLILVLGSFSNHLEAREEPVLPRQTFLDFPLSLGTWNGTPSSLEQRYIDTLRFDDYFLADYREPGTSFLPVNFYVAYYQSQRAGTSIHSPKSCIPGGGWLIDSTDTLSIQVSDSPHPLMVNEVLIKKDEVQQLVFYWFQQRGRNLTNEYLVKWFLLWDALMQGRSDGALVRLTTMIGPGEDVETAKDRLMAFARVAHTHLSPFIPN